MSVHSSWLLYLNCEIANKGTQLVKNRRAKYDPYSENLLKFVRNCLPHRFIESFYKLASCLKIPFSKRLELFSGFQVQPVNQWVRPNMNFTLSTFNPYTYDIDNVPRPIQLQNKNIIAQIQLGEIISQRAFSFSPKIYLRFSKFRFSVQVFCKGRKNLEISE